MELALRKYLKFLARADIFFVTLLWLMVLLVVGTVEQKFIGLYQSQQLYFNTFITWLGYIPTPGGYSLIGFIFLQLLVKLVFFSQWKRAKAGIIIVHTGAILLLLGGIITAFSSYEGSMIIYEGESSNFISDYHKRELVIFTTSAEEGEIAQENTIQSIAFDDLKQGDTLSVSEISPSFKVEVIKMCHNCEIGQLETPRNNQEYKGMAGRLEINQIVKAIRDEDNRSAIMFRVSGAGDKQDGIYISVDFINVSPKITLDNKIYNIALRAKRTYLPFSIELIDFEKKYYPNTRTPRSYKSEIIVTNAEDLKWRAVVAMNQPMRYKGYTLFQSSFVDTGESEATIFAVVSNYGRLFPYISSSIICIGLLIHIFLKIPQLIGRRKQ